ncbi:MAG: hypothetical protein HLX45_13190 [Bacillus sp. (in: Bacteria)]|nr:hypothetical protein [Bacillus sp. (in: firmicutes)]
MHFINLKGKSKSQLEDMLLEKQDDLLFAYKLIQQGTPKSALAEEIWKIEQEISIIERKLKRK